MINHPSFDTPRCPDCGSNEVVSLAMAVGESDLRFTCCQTCEARRWEREGESIPLRSVLDLVASH
jgi:hypothetical protein